jgi:hypothetical protein
LKERYDAPKYRERGQSGISDDRDPHGCLEVFILTSLRGSATSSDLTFSKGPG